MATETQEPFFLRALQQYHMQQRLLGYKQIHTRKRHRKHVEGEVYQALDTIEQLPKDQLRKLHAQLLNPALKFNFNKEILFTLIMEARNREQLSVAWEFNTLRQPIQEQSQTKLRKEDISQVTIIIAFLTAYRPKSALGLINQIAPTSYNLARVYFKAAFYDALDQLNITELQDQIYNEYQERSLFDYCLEENDPLSLPRQFLVLYLIKHNRFFDAIALATNTPMDQEIRRMLTKQELDALNDYVSTASTAIGLRHDAKRFSSSLQNDHLAQQRKSLTPMTVASKFTPFPFVPLTSWLPKMQTMESDLYKDTDFQVIEEYLIQLRTTYESDDFDEENEEFRDRDQTEEMIVSEDEEDLFPEPKRARIEQDEAEADQEEPSSQSSEAEDVESEAEVVANRGPLSIRSSSTPSMATTSEPEAEPALASPLLDQQENTMDDAENTQISARTLVADHASDSGDESSIFEDVDQTNLVHQETVLTEEKKAVDIVFPLSPNKVSPMRQQADGFKTPEPVRLSETATGSSPLRESPVTVRYGSRFSTPTRPAAEVNASVHASPQINASTPISEAQNHLLPPGTIMIPGTAHPFKARSLSPSRNTAQLTKSRDARSTSPIQRPHTLTIHATYRGQTSDIIRRLRIPLPVEAPEPTNTNTPPVIAGGVASQRSTQESPNSSPAQTLPIIEIHPVLSSGVMQGQSPEFELSLTSNSGTAEQIRVRIDRQRLQSDHPHETPFTYLIQESISTERTATDTTTSTTRVEHNQSVTQPAASSSAVMSPQDSLVRNSSPPDISSPSPNKAVRYTTPTQRISSSPQPAAMGSPSRIVTRSVDFLTPPRADQSPYESKDSQASPSSSRADARVTRRTSPLREAGQLEDREPTLELSPSLVINSPRMPAAESQGERFFDAPPIRNGMEESTDMKSSPQPVVAVSSEINRFQTPPTEDDHVQPSPVRSNEVVAARVRFTTPPVSASSVHVTGNSNSQPQRFDSNLSMSQSGSTLRHELRDRIHVQAEGGVNQVGSSSSVPPSNFSTQNPPMPLASGQIKVSRPVLRAPMAIRQGKRTAFERVAKIAAVTEQKPMDSQATNLPKAEIESHIEKHQEESARQLATPQPESSTISTPARTQAAQRSAPTVQPNRRSASTSPDKSSSSKTATQSSAGDQPSVANLSSLGQASTGTDRASTSPRRKLRKASSEKVEELTTPTEDVDITDIPAAITASLEIAHDARPNDIRVTFHSPTLLQESDIFGSIEAIEPITLASAESTESAEPRRRGSREPKRQAKTNHEDEIVTRSSPSPRRHPVAKDTSDTEPERTSEHVGQAVEAVNESAAFRAPVRSLRSASKQSSTPSPRKNAKVKNPNTLEDTSRALPVIEEAEPDASSKRDINNTSARSPHATFASPLTLPDNAVEDLISEEIDIPSAATDPAESRSTRESSRTARKTPRGAKSDQTPPQTAKSQSVSVNEAINNNIGNSANEPNDRKPPAKQDLSPKRTRASSAVLPQGDTPDPRKKRPKATHPPPLQPAGSAQSDNVPSRRRTSIPTFDEIVASATRQSTRRSQPPQVPEIYNQVLGHTSTPRRARKPAVEMSANAVASPKLRRQMSNPVMSLLEENKLRRSNRNTPGRESILPQISEESPANVNHNNTRELRNRFPSMPPPETQESRLRTAGDTPKARSRNAKLEVPATVPEKEEPASQDGLQVRDMTNAHASFAAPSTPIRRSRFLEVPTPGTRRSARQAARSHSQEADRLALEESPFREGVNMVIPGVTRDGIVFRRPSDQVVIGVLRDGQTYHPPEEIEEE